MLGQRNKYLAGTMFPLTYLIKNRVRREAKHFFYLGYIGQGSDFNTAYSKIAIQTLRWTLKVRVNNT